MRFSEFKRWLQSKGVIFKPGKKHDKVYFAGKQTVFPRHQSQEVGEDFRKRLLKQLGLEDD